MAAADADGTALRATPSPRHPAGSSFDTATSAPAPRPVPTTEETARLVDSRTVARRAVGRSDLRVFPIALSGNVFGWTADAAATEAVLDAFAAQGGDFLDTADSYASGRSETMIGQWMRSRAMRDRMTVATKVGKSAEHPGLGTRALTRAVHASLQRLQTDRIDLLYLHIDDPDVPLEETILAVDELVRSGDVLHYGASDHTADRLFQARIASAQEGAASMVALQKQYNLMHRHDYEGELERVAALQGLGFMPRFALGAGFLTGKYRRKADLARGSRERDVARHLNRRGLRVLAALDQVARENDAAPATIAIAWLLARPHVVAPVVSASSPEQVVDLTAATGIRLTRAQIALLEKASA